MNNKDRLENRLTELFQEGGIPRANGIQYHEEGAQFMDKVPPYQQIKSALIIVGKNITSAVIKKTAEIFVTKQI